MEKQHIKELIVRVIILFVGTIICAFLVGPVAGFFLPRNERIIEKIVSRIR